MPKHVRKTLSRKELALQQRRLRVLELYEHDLSIRAIADHINKDRVAAGERPLSHQAYHHDLIQILEDEAAEFKLKSKHHVNLVIRQLKRISGAHMTKLLKASNADEFEKYTRGFDRIWKRYDAMLGIAKPEKIELTGAEGGPIESRVRVILPPLIETEEEQ